MIKDQQAWKKRKAFFKELPKKNWALLDSQRYYCYRKDRLKTARQFGFKYISQCTAHLYFLFMSYTKTAEALNLSTEGVRAELKYIGIEFQPPGGYRPGDKRFGRQSGDWNKKVQ